MNYKKFIFGILAGLAVSANATKYEAEDLSDIDAADIIAGEEYSGGKYVKPAVYTDGLTFNVTVEETAIYDIETTVRIKVFDWITCKIVINGIDVGSLLATPRNVDSNYVVTASAKMKAGENKITVGNSSIGVDYITVNKHPDPVYTISEAPVTPGATESAFKVYSFLKENFMKKTISGMMISDQNFNYHYGDTTETGAAVPESNWLILPGQCTPADSCKYTDEQVSWKGQTDIAEFYKRSGHYPAIGGFDMLFAAGGNHDKGWFLGYTENNLVMTEELWKMGGIPTYTWHWKVGKDTVFNTKDTYPKNGFNADGCKEGVMGTSEGNTCFNYTKAFKGEACAEVDPTSKVYKDIVADVDIVSVYFKQLEEKDIAVVWRPLHEASGGWFWWGVASPECYVQLWRLVFDRMVNVNKNKNLIWVWNINTDPKFGYDYSALNGAWYPGDEYVDIVAVDIYDPLNNHNSAANYWNKIIEEVGTNKMIALSENGAIPDIDSIAEDKSYWSYWMTWSQTWSGNFLEKTSADMWKRNLDDERVIALDDMPGWDKYSTSINPRNNRQVANKLTTKVSGKNLSLVIPLSGYGSIDIFDLQGNNVTSLVKGRISAGTMQFSLDKLARGNYIVRAKVNSSSMQQVIRLR